MLTGQKDNGAFGRWQHHNNESPRPFGPRETGGMHSRRASPCLLNHLKTETRPGFPVNVLETEGVVSAFQDHNGLCVAGTCATLAVVHKLLVVEGEHNLVGPRSYGGPRFRVFKHDERSGEHKTEISGATGMVALGAMSDLPPYGSNTSTR
jgi:hypothetical protein